MSKVNFIVLAGGTGSRFGKNPKLLQSICGKTVLDYVLELTSDPILVTTEAISKHAVSQRAAKVVIQTNPNGSGAAFLLGIKDISEGPVIVLLGDCPLVSPSTIEFIKNNIKNHDVIFGVFATPNENSYGRIKSNQGKYKVVEYKENPEPAKLYNAGWICFGEGFIKNLPKLKQVYPELYLTQYIELAENPLAFEVSPDEALGVNTFNEYQQIQSIIQTRLLNNLAINGVDFRMPSRVDINFDTQIGPNSIIHSNVAFGQNVILGSNVIVLPFSYLTDVCIGDNCTIGPFAHLRGGTMLDQNVQIGSFCEVKNSKIDFGTKAKHVSYIGDANIGRNVNVGAGTVICNYDGTKKSITTIEDNVFLGGNTTYVAPIIIEQGAYIGAGTTIRRDVPNNTLIVTNQKHIEYKRRKCED